MEKVVRTKKSALFVVIKTLVAIGVGVVLGIKMLEPQSGGSGGEVSSDELAFRFVFAFCLGLCLFSPKYSLAWARFFWSKLAFIVPKYKPLPYGRPDPVTGYVVVTRGERDLVDTMNFMDKLLGLVIKLIVLVIILLVTLAFVSIMTLVRFVMALVALFQKPKVVSIEESNSQSDMTEVASDNIM